MSSRGEAGRRTLGAVLAAAIAAAGCTSGGERAPGPFPPTYVGRAACFACHREEASRYEGSHHDLALRVATDGTVLGDFRDVVFPRSGGDFRFLRKDGDFVVRITEAGGAERDLPVKWTFGVTPLQQYLVFLGDGRVQALPVAWDARSREDGGQRWFDLFPKANAGDVLAWDGLALNWNRMCAECHSTGLSKNWDPATERYETSWVEEDVSCEACHGRGSVHVAWARLGDAARARWPDHGLEVHVGDGTPGAWILADGKDTAELARPRAVAGQVETCGRCHAHRARIAEDVPSAPLAESHVVSLLEEGLTWADGQVEDEVYEYGSFRQSRMAARGVVCSDCHDPHTARLMLTGDDVCLRCHRAETFAARAHHRHDPAGAGARCVACHMSRHVFMGIDVRVDHGFRVPRPDLSRDFGTPNACNDCHADHDAAWAADAVASWTDGRAAERPSWGPALDAGRRWQSGAAEELRRLTVDGETPAIVRATALELLARVGAADLAAAVERGAADPDPLVRRAAAGALASLPADGRRRTGAPLLTDPVRTVRLAAVLPLLEAGVPVAGTDTLPGLEVAVREFRASQAFLDDGAAGSVNLGNLERTLGHEDEAEAAYRRALRRQPSFVPAAVNLAERLGVAGRWTEAEAVLRDVLSLVPEAAAAHHALGLSLVLANRRGEALIELHRAAELAPEEPRFAWVLGVALAESGDASGARRVREDAARRFPAYPAFAAGPP